MSVTINYVWFGNGALGNLEKFNIYSWRALGHNVTIYACKWNCDAHSADSLGVKEKNVNVVNLSDIPDQGGTMPLTRQLLNDWLDYARAHPPTAPNQQVYNVVDLAKSYIGGTQRGIVLDLKGGPSPHVPAYLTAFNTKFVSYTRGRPGQNTAGGLPENQCMGTMEQGATLRGKYAAKFESGLSVRSGGDDPQGMKATPAGTHFNTITGLHGQGCTNGVKGGYLDVSAKGPDGGSNAGYPVAEIGATFHGPFRIFKPAGQQTNRGGGPTNAKGLAQQVWDQELKNSGGDDHFLKKLSKILDGWH